jgi:hypothetical protein
VAGVAHDDGDPAPEPASAVGVAATGGVLAMTEPVARASSLVPQMEAGTASVYDDDDVIEEPEVILRHPGLGAPGQVSVPEAVDMTLSTLQQERDVLLRDRRGLNEEWQCLVGWTTSEK